MPFNRTWEEIHAVQQKKNHPKLISVNNNVDYGSDPLGDNKYKMIPSGDIVNLVERNRRLTK